MQHNRPRVGLGVFVMKGEDMLIGLRSGEHMSGVWCFPGGHLEYGESWEECAIRETFEETGVTVANLRHVATTNDIHESEGLHYITLFMMGDYVDGEVELKEPDKFIEWKWSHWDDLPENLFISTKKLKKQGFDPYTC